MKSRKLSPFEDRRDPQTNTYLHRGRISGEMFAVPADHELAQRLKQLYQQEQLKPGVTAAVLSLMLLILLSIITGLVLAAIDGRAVLWLSSLVYLAAIIAFLGWTLKSASAGGWPRGFAILRRLPNTAAVALTVTTVVIDGFSLAWLALFLIPYLLTILFIVVSAYVKPAAEPRDELNRDIESHEEWLTQPMTAIEQGKRVGANVKHHRAARRGD